jgi:hypothetical protein
MQLSDVGLQAQDFGALRHLPNVSPRTTRSQSAIGFYLFGLLPHHRGDLLVGHCPSHGAATVCHDHMLGRSNLSHGPVSSADRCMASSMVIKRSLTSRYMALSCVTLESSGGVTG